MKIEEKAMQAMELLKREFSIFGNGDPKKGLHLFMVTTARLTHARKKHEWKGQTNEWGAWAVFDEAQELVEATKYEQGKRHEQYEAVDTIATAVRHYNREWE